ncbi:unnamed protein product [Arabidopsis halleri]
METSSFPPPSPQHQSSSKNQLLHHHHDLYLYHNRRFPSSPCDQANDYTCYHLLPQQS